MSVTTLSEHTNSEGERITIDLINDGAFAGRQVLCVRDDPPGTAIAPHLLDDGTKKWLREWLAADLKGRDHDG